MSISKVVLGTLAVQRFVTARCFALLCQQVTRVAGRTGCRPGSPQGDPCRGVQCRVGSMHRRTGDLLWRQIGSAHGGTQDRTATTADSPQETGLELSLHCPSPASWYGAYCGFPAAPSKVFVIVECRVWHGLSPVVVDDYESRGFPGAEVVYWIHAFVV